MYCSVITFFTLCLHIEVIVCCSTILDCSLNGICQASTCICDPPWSGPTCSVLQEAAVVFPQGYGQSPLLTSWGGSILTDPVTGKHHLYVSTLTNSCPLLYWQTNSRIDHAVADNITGPYVFQDVAVNTWATNPATLVLADGRYAMVHIGEGTGAPDGGQHCTNDIPQYTDYTGRRGSTIHVSRSVSGPWEPLLENTLGECNNPAPWQHSNGSLYIVCTLGYNHVLKTAPAISGPWQVVTNISIQPDKHGTVYEDPYLWVDTRGHWHLLMHAYNTKEDRTQCTNSTVSLHAYSEDGHHWLPSPDQPYTTQVNVGSHTITQATRERPKLVISPVSGAVTHLVTSVCSVPSCPHGPPTGCVDCKYRAHDYTLVTPLIH